MTSPAQQAQHRVAAAARHGNRPAELRARQDLAAARIAAVIETSRALSPPLRDDQAQQLATMLMWGEPWSRT